MAGVISFDFPSYFAEKSKKSFSEIISVIGSTQISLLIFTTPPETSVPSQELSTISWESSLNDFSIAPTKPFFL